jgi:hypothetical protein
MYHHVHLILVIFVFFFLRWGLTVLPRLVLNSWAQMILLLWPLKCCHHVGLCLLFFLDQSSEKFVRFINIFKEQILVPIFPICLFSVSLISALIPFTLSLIFLFSSFLSWKLKLESSYFIDFFPNFLLFKTVEVEISF